MAKEEKLFTPGNIILGIIIVVLLGSLFFDFFGGSNDNPEEIIGCPRPFENLIISNIVYAADGEPMFEDRIIKEEDKPGVKYTISALLRNIGDEKIVISKLGLTTENMGALSIVDVTDIVIGPKSMEAVNFELPSGGYHKIDFYGDDPCLGTIVWHEYGEGSKYAWQLENNSNSTNSTPINNETINN